MGLNTQTASLGWKKALIVQAAVYLVAFISLVFWLQTMHLANAAGGIFTIEVTPQQASYASGSEVTFDINYSCNGATSTDTCDDCHYNASSIRTNDKRCDLRIRPDS